MPGHAITGKTRLQKITYLCNHAGITEWKYRMSQFGPSSEELAKTIKFAESTKFITISNHKMPTYQLANLGENVLKEFKQQHFEITNTIKSMVVKLATWENDELTQCATLELLKKHDPDIGKKALISKTKDILCDYKHYNIGKTYQKVCFT